MARICYIYREKEKNEHSIELVFDAVCDEMEKLGHTVEKWYKPVSWRQTFSEMRRLRKRKYDLYHITGDVNYLWLFLPWKRTTMTVHDIGYYKNHPKTLKRRLLALFSCVVPAWFLRKYTCVSQLTRDDLVHILKISPKRLEVIPNPIVLDIKPEPKTFNEESPVIMQIGTGWHKNLDSLIESVKGLDCRLDIIGSPEQTLIERMDSLGIVYRTSSGLTDAEIIDRYRQSDILFFVSRSEGFGLPILEAQSMGRPVLTSSEAPMPFVAGEGALFFSPGDIAGIRAGILSLIADGALRNKLIDTGYRNVNRFSRDAIGKLYYNFYLKHFNVEA